MNFLIDATWNFVPSALILVSFRGCHAWAESLGMRLKVFYVTEARLPPAM